MRRAAYLALLFALALLLMDSTRPKPARSDTGCTAPRPASSGALIDHSGFGEKS